MGQLEKEPREWFELRDQIFECDFPQELKDLTKLYNCLLYTPILIQDLRFQPDYRCLKNLMVIRGVMDLSLIHIL